MKSEHRSKREVYGKPADIFKAGLRWRPSAWSLPDRINGKPNSSQNGEKKKRHERKIRPNLQQKFREVGRKNFKAAKIATRPAKISCFGEKFQARYNKNARIKMLAGEGVESRYGANRSGKGDWKPRSEGKTDTKWIIVERVFLKNTCEKSVITV